MSPETTGEMAVETLKGKGNFQRNLPRLGVDRDQAAFHEEDHLPLPVDRGHHGRGVGDPLVAGLPDDRAGVLVQAQHRFARPAAGDEDQVAIDGHGGGAVPLDIPPMVLFHQIAFPDRPARLGVEATGDQVGREQVDLAVAHGGRGPRTVAAAGRVAAAVAFAPGDIGDPEFLAGCRVQGQADFPRIAVDLAHHLREDLAVADGEGTEARVGRLSPNDLGAVAAPLDVDLFQGDSVLVRPAIEGPIGRMRQSTRQEKRNTQNQRNRSHHPHYEPPGSSLKQNNTQRSYFRYRRQACQP